MVGMRFTTESGTLYHIDYAPSGQRWLTRHRAEDGGELRQDGGAIEIIDCSFIEVGRPMRFLLDLLQDGETITTRTTTPVVKYWTSLEEVSQL